MEEGKQNAVEYAVQSWGEENSKIRLGRQQRERIVKNEKERDAEKLS